MHEVAHDRSRRGNDRDHRGYAHDHRGYARDLHGNDRVCGPCYQYGTRYEIRYPLFRQRVEARTRQGRENARAHRLHGNDHDLGMDEIM